MSFLSDGALAHLRSVADEPDLSGTRYRLIDRIGRGGMGAVYRAEDTALRREVALKVLSAPDPDGTLAARLTNEARVLARLEHAGIVPVHDVGRLPDGRTFYVMRLVRGRRLDEHAPAVSGTAAALRIVQRLCEAVAFAHAHGVLHRDLKPENVMVGEFGEVLAMDWGVAKVLDRPEPETAAAAMDARRSASIAGDDAHATQHGTRIGTPGYMAPEQAAGDTGRVDRRADVFGIGNVLAYLLVRGDLGRGESPRDALARNASRVPRPLRAIAERALATEPERRYATVDQLSAELDRYLAGMPVLAYRENLLERAGRFAHRYRTAIALVLTYMVLRVLLLLFAR